MIKPYILGKIGVKTVAASVLALALAVAVTLSESASSGASRGLNICADTLIPALFPFMAAANFLVMCGGADVLVRLTGRLSSFVFGNRAAFTVFILSLLGGYPVGSVCAETLLQNGVCGRKSAAGAVCFCVNASPAFIITAVGRMMYRSTEAGIALFAANLAASFCTGLVFSRLDTLPRGAVLGAGLKKQAGNEAAGGFENPPLCDTFTQAVAKSCTSMLYICGFVVVFSALGGLLKATGAPESVLAGIQAFFEFSSGSQALRALPASLPVMAAAVSFGGICVHFQCMSLARNVFPRSSVFIAARMLHALLCAGFTFIYCLIFPGAAGVYARAELSEACGNPLIGIMIPVCMVMFLADFYKSTAKTQKNLEKKPPFSRINL